MIITDFNQMSVEDLMIFNAYLGVTYEINDGAIKGATRGLEDEE